MYHFFGNVFEGASQHTKLQLKKKTKNRKTWDKGNRRFSISKRIRNGVEGNPGRQLGSSLEDSWT